MKRNTVVAALAVVAIVFALGRYQQAEGKMRKQAFGKMADGRQADLYVLTNKNGMEVAITNFGGAVVSVKVPDRNGKLGDVVLGYDNLDGYINDKAFFGGLIGRYANRIAHGQFKLDGKTYNVPKNDGENSLHGGIKGFNTRLWEAKEIPSKQAQVLQLHYLSKDGEEGYPGDLSVQVTYTLTDNNELKIDYAATTDKDTVLNLTNHSYFNLAGEGDILQHQLLLHAAKFTPVDATLIPTGEIRPVKGTPMDFTTAHAVGERINQDYEQLKLGHGYDHNWVVDGNMGTLRPAARVYEAKTGRVMEVSTTEPGIQFYSGNFLDGTIHGKGGKVYQHRAALCLETQHYPDSPNHPQFPTTELKPGQKFHSITVFKFSTK